jgi:hypothetical protein
MTRDTLIKRFIKIYAGEGEYLNHKDRLIRLVDFVLENYIPIGQEMYEGYFDGFLDDIPNDKRQLYYGKQAILIIKDEE